MADVTLESQLRLWSGDTYIALYSTDTVFGNFYMMGHVPTCEIAAPELTEKEEIGRTASDFGAQISNSILETKQAFTLTTKSITKENLVAGLSGTSSDDNQAGATVTDLELTSELDMWQDLGFRDVTITTVNSLASTAGTVYTEDDDWVVDESTGLIKFLSTGDIVDATSTFVVFDHAAITVGWEVGANLNQAQRYKLILRGETQINAGHGQLVIPKCSFDLAGAMAFIQSDGNQELQLQGTMIKMAGQDLFTVKQWP